MSYFAKDTQQATNELFKRTNILRVGIQRDFARLESRLDDSARREAILHRRIRDLENTVACLMDGADGRGPRVKRARF